VCDFNEKMIEGLDVFVVVFLFLLKKCGRENNLKLHMYTTPFIWSFYISFITNSKMAYHLVAFRVINY
jgi:hypothetical protein